MVRVIILYVLVSLSFGLLFGFNTEASYCIKQPSDMQKSECNTSASMSNLNQVKFFVNGLNTFTQYMPGQIYDIIANFPQMCGLQFILLDSTNNAVGSFSTSDLSIKVSSVCGSTIIHASETPKTTVTFSWNSTGASGPLRLVYTFVKSRVGTTCSWYFDSIPITDLSAPKVPSLAAKRFVQDLSQSTAVPSDLAAQGYYNAVQPSSGLIVAWKASGTSISIAARCTTSGWVGVGFSPASAHQMLGSDAVTGSWNTTTSAVDFGVWQLVSQSAGSPQTNIASILPITNTFGTLVNGVLTIGFTRSFTSGNVAQTQNAQNPIIAACCSSPFPSFHDRGYDPTYSVDWDQAAPSTTASSTTTGTTSTTGTTTGMIPSTTGTPSPVPGNTPAAKGYTESVDLLTDTPGLLVLYWKPNDGTTPLEMALQGNGVSGWIAVGWPAPGATSSAAMVGSDAVIGWVQSDGSSNVNGYSLNGKLSSQVVVNPNFVISATSAEQVSGALTIYFTRTYATGNNPLTINSPNQVIGSYSNNVPNPTIQKHYDRSTQITSIDYQTGSSSVAAPTLGLRDAHGIIMFFAWAVILPFGVMWARYAKGFPDAIWFKVHQVTQPIGYILAIVGFIIAWVMASGVYFNSLAHSVIGIVIMALGLAQLLGGIFRPHKDDNADKQRPARVAFEYGHRWNGRLLLILVIPQIFLGIIAIQTWSKAVLIFYAVYVIAIFIIVIILEIKNKAQGKPFLP